MENINITNNDIIGHMRRLIRCGYGMALNGANEKEFEEWLNKIVPHPFIYKGSDEN